MYVRVRTWGVSQQGYLFMQCSALFTLLQGSSGYLQAVQHMSTCEALL